MTSEESRASALAAFIDLAMKPDAPEPGSGPLVDALTARIALEMRAEALALSCDEGFIPRLEAQLFGATPAPILPPIRRRGDAHDRPRFAIHIPWRAAPRRRCIPVAALALLLLCGLILALPARAQLANLSCLIPGLGIRSCSAPGLIANGPVSSSHGGTTLTIQALLSSDGHTVMRLDITGLPSAPDHLAPGPLHIILSDTVGRVYTPVEGWATWVDPQHPESLSATATFKELDANVRRVMVQVDEPQPIGVWLVRVPVAPIDRVISPAAHAGAPGAIVHGIAVRIAGLVANSSGTTLQLTGQTDKPSLGIVNLANHQPILHPLMLRDDQGRTYPEQPTPPEALPRLGSGFVGDVSFPPLTPGARSIALSIPFVTTIEQTSPLVIRIPVKGKTTGDHIALNLTIKLGSYPFRVIAADIMELPPGVAEGLTNRVAGPWLVLHVDYGIWHASRQLVGPGVVENAHAIQSQPQGDAGGFTYVSVPLSEASAGVASVTMQNARVAVKGPWNLQMPLP